MTANEKKIREYMEELGYRAISVRWVKETRRYVVEALLGEASHIIFGRTWHKVVDSATREAAGPTIAEVRSMAEEFAEAVYLDDWRDLAWDHHKAEAIALKWAKRLSK